MTNTTTLTWEIVLVQETCINCGVAFGLPLDLQNQRRKDHLHFYCPNGHPQYFPTDNEVEKLKKQLASQKEEIKYYQQRAENVENSLRATKGQVTKLKKRIANGVCPCCSRHFTNLQRHMKTKHPDYSTENQEEL